MPYEDTCLLELKRLRKMYGDQVKKVGFPGRHLGIAPDIAAFTLGAQVIERNFTFA